MQSHFKSTKPLFTADPGQAAQAREKELIEAFSQVIQSGLFILGESVAKFEKVFSQWQGCEHTIGVANGTDALELSLRAVGIEAGDLVLAPTHTAVATATAIVRAGAIPVLIDVDPVTMNMNLDQVEEVLEAKDYRAKIKGIIPVHLYGAPIDMDRVSTIALKYGLKVIEDCSQAHGAFWNGKRVGSFGDVAAFSCYPTKNLGAIGDAGLVITDNSRTAAAVRELRQYGWKERYISDEVGMNSRLDELQAALLLVQLKYLDADIARRRAIAAIYREELQHLPLQLPSVNAMGVHAFHQFTVRTSTAGRDALKNYLHENQVIAAVLYPAPIHRQPAYVEFANQFPLNRTHAEEACQSLLCLPIHPKLSDNDVARVCDLLKSYRWN